MFASRSRLALLALPLALAACAPKSVAPIAAAPAAIPPRPIQPAAAYGAVVLPPKTIDGAWSTPNRDLAGTDAAWHLRAALNVAALRCTGPEVATITANYNAMIRIQKGPIDKAYKAIRARYKAADAKQWQTNFDGDSTRLYNFFANPSVKPAFCAAAYEIALQVMTIKPAGFEAFAAITLPALDRQFTDFYDNYVAWQTAVAEWDARYGAPTAAPVVTASVN